MPDGDLRILLATAPEEIARSIADRLLDRRLAACVNLVPGVLGVFRWEGEKDEATETILLVKTRAALVEEATRTIVEAHTYDVPEVLELPVLGGHEAYVDWVRRETRS